MIEDNHDSIEAQREISETSEGLKKLGDTWIEELPDNYKGLSAYVRLLAKGDCFNRDFLTYASALNLYDPTLEVEADEEEKEFLSSGKLDFLLTNEDQKEHPSSEDVIEYIRESWAGVFKKVLTVLGKPEILNEKSRAMYNCVFQPDRYVSIKSSRVEGLKGLVSYLSRTDDGYDVKLRRELMHNYFERVEIERLPQESDEKYEKRVNKIKEKYSLLGFSPKDYNYNDLTTLI